MTVLQGPSVVVFYQTHVEKGLLWAHKAMHFGSSWSAHSGVPTSLPRILRIDMTSLSGMSKRSVRSSGGKDLCAGEVS